MASMTKVGAATGGVREAVVKLARQHGGTIEVCTFQYFSCIFHVFFMCFSGISRYFCILFS